MEICKVCGKPILYEKIIVPKMDNRLNILEESIDICKTFEIEKDYVHDYCLDFYQEKTYYNWLKVNRHNKFFVENTSLFPEHFMYNHRKCKFCDNQTDIFAVYNFAGRTHISVLTNIKYEETTCFAAKLFLPLCNRHYAEYYNEFSKETFSDTYNYSEDIVGDFSQFKETAEAEEWANENVR